MLAAMRHELHARIRQPLGRVTRVGPLDQRRQEASPGAMPILGNRDSPSEDRPRCIGMIDPRSIGHRVTSSSMSRVRATQWISAGPSANARAHPRLVEIEPARPLRRAAVRIDRDDFQVHARAERSKALCVPIATCLPPGCGARRPFFDPRDTLLEVRCRHDQMIERKLRRGAMRDVTRAPRFGVSRLVRCEIELDASAVRVEEEHLPTCRPRLPPARMRDVARRQQGERVGEIVRRERHMVDDTGAKLFGGRPPMTCRIGASPA